MMGFLSFYYKAQADTTPIDWVNLSVTEKSENGASGTDYPNSPTYFPYVNIKNTVIILTLKINQLVSFTDENITSGNILVDSIPENKLIAGESNTNYGSFTIETDPIDNTKSNLLISTDNWDNLLNYSADFIFKINGGVLKDSSGNPNPLLSFKINKYGDTKIPEATIEYSTTDPTKEDVVATVKSSEPFSVSNNDGLNSYTFTDNGDFTFNILNRSNNVLELTASVKNIDRVNPVLVLNGDANIDIYKGDTYEDAGANFTDNKDSSYTVYGDTKVDISTPGVYTINYNASDRAGNLADKISRTVNVLEKKMPKSSSSGSYIGGYKPLIKNITQTNIETATGQVLGAEKYNFTLNLGYGSRGDEVLELQKLLNLAGYKSGPEDGIFGPITKGAVIRFQIANGLTGDGIVGPLSREELNK